MIGNEVDLVIGSALEHLDLVEAITDCITEFMKFDEDTAHWIGMSVRESVINAIQHGNKFDPGKKVDIRFEIVADRLTISVVDQGSGFAIDDLPNPLDPDDRQDHRGCSICGVHCLNGLHGRSGPWQLSCIPHHRQH